jgi:taurine dioxygenase
MADQGLQIHPMTGYIGAEISGIDLGGQVSDAEIAAIRLALSTHGVIFFRDQVITPEQHDALANRFGDPTDVRFVKTVDGYGSMSEVAKEAEDKHNIGGGWHADQTFHDVPPLGALLVARDLPSHGGDTLFSSQAAAYDALSDGLKETLEGLTAVHSNFRLLKSANPNIVNQGSAVREAIHPVIIRHPVTGRKSVFVNRMYTSHFVGWTEEESAPLLNFLYLHGQRPEFQVRFQWRAGSIAFWDNIQVWHYAVNDYHGQRRYMHRVAIKGAPLIAA